MNGTDALDRDSDGDVFSDGLEVASGSGPLNPTGIPLGEAPDAIPGSLEEARGQAGDLAASGAGLPP